MISAKELYKLLVYVKPTCSKCRFFNGENIYKGTCKKFGNIIYARTSELQCSIDGKYFIPKVELLK